MLVSTFDEITFRRRLILRLYTFKISLDRMKWSVSSTLGRNLDVLAEEESEEEEVDDGHKREVSHNVTVHAGMKRSDFQFFF